MESIRGSSTGYVVPLLRSQANPAEVRVNAVTGWRTRRLGISSD
jgi:hypothetical protein